MVPGTLELGVAHPPTFRNAAFIENSPEKHRPEQMNFAPELNPHTMGD